MSTGDLGVWAAVSGVVAAQAIETGVSTVIGSVHTASSTTAAIATSALSPTFTTIRLTAGCSLKGTNCNRVRGSDFSLNLRQNIVIVVDESRMSLVSNHLAYVSIRMWKRVFKH